MLDRVNCASRSVLDTLDTWNFSHVAQSRWIFSVMLSSHAGSSQSCRPVMLVTGRDNTFLDSQVVIERGENLVGKTTEVLNRSMQHIGGMWMDEREDCL
jgi:hypothetical protein